MRKILAILLSLVVGIGIVVPASAYDGGIMPLSEIEHFSESNGVITMSCDITFGTVNGRNNITNVSNVTTTVIQGFGTSNVFNMTGWSWSTKNLRQTAVITVTGKLQYAGGDLVGMFRDVEYTFEITP